MSLTNNSTQTVQPAQVGTVITLDWKESTPWSVCVVGASDSFELQIGWAAENGGFQHTAYAQPEHPDPIQYGYSQLVWVEVPPLSGDGATNQVSGTVVVTQGFLPRTGNRAVKKFGISVADTVATGNLTLTRPRTWNREFRVYRGTSATVNPGESSWDFQQRIAAGPVVVARPFTTQRAADATQAGDDRTNEWQPFDPEVNQLHLVRDPTVGAFVFTVETRLMM